MSDTSRAHRVVELRADEVAHIQTEISNAKWSGACCPHLDSFHDSGVTIEGGSWRYCNVRGCECAQDVKPSRMRQAMDAQDKALDRAEHRFALQGAFLLGCASVGVAWALWAVFA